MNYYPNSSGFDLREKFHAMLHGDYQTEGIGRPLLLRKMTTENCVCWDGLSGSPDSHCRFCQGEGYHFTEEMVTGYIARNFGSVLNSATAIPQQNFLASYGLTDSQRALAFLEYSVYPDYERYLIQTTRTHDALYEVKVTESGDLFYPVTRVAKWRIKSLTPHHGDHGKIEYLELGIEKENL